MMGRLNRDQGQLFYSFCLDEAVPDDHRVRDIAAVLDLSWVHAELAPHYSHLGRPSIDPVLMIRMLILGYVFAIRSERLLCREVQVNLAYRWFCGLSIEDRVPDHSAFSRARNERFRDSDIFRRVFERVVETCIAKKAGPRIAPVHCAAGSEGETNLGVTSLAAPKAASSSVARYLIDVKVGIIMDVEASRAIRQAEVGAARTMIERTEERFGVRPERLAADTAYGSAANLGWLVNEKQIAPHIP